MLDNNLNDENPKLKLIVLLDISQALYIACFQHKFHTKIQNISRNMAPLMFVTPFWFYNFIILFFNLFINQ